MVHWLAVGGALGHGALAATTAHTNAVDNVTCMEEKKTPPWDWLPVPRGVAVSGCAPRHSPCLALYPSLRALSGRVGLGARWRLDSWRYCQQRTRSRKRITSDCFLRHNSCIYLYAPMLTYLQRGSDIRLSTTCLWTPPANWTHLFHWTGINKPSWMQLFVQYKLTFVSIVCFQNKRSSQYSGSTHSKQNNCILAESSQYHFILSALFTSFPAFCSWLYKNMFTSNI